MIFTPLCKYVNAQHSIFGNKLYEAVDFEIMLHDPPWARTTKNVKKPPGEKGQTFRK